MHKRLFITFHILLFSSILFSQRIFVDSVNYLIADACTTVPSEKKAKLLNVLAYAQTNRHAAIDEVDILIRLATYELSVANFIGALDWITKASRIAENQSLHFLQGEIYFQMGEVYTKMGNWTKALEAYQKGKKILLEQKDSFGLAKVYNRLGFATYRTNQKELSLPYYEKSVDLMQRHGGSHQLLTAQSNLAVYFLYENQPDKALPYFQKSKSINLQLNDQLKLAQVYGNLGYTYGLLKDYEKAFINYDSSALIAKKEGLKETLYITYLDMADTYAAKGDYKNAFKYQKSHQQLKESVNNKAVGEKIEELKVQYETEKNQRTLANQKNQITQLQQQSIINRQKQLLSLIGTLVLAISLLLLFLNYRSKRKKTIAKFNAQQKVLQSEITKKAAKENKLKEQLENKNKDITNLSLDIVRKNEFSEELKKRLDELEEELPTSLQEKVKNLQILMVSHLQINDDLVTLQTNVEQVNQEFYKSLDLLGKDLSQNEKQLCGLIRLNLSNKEIAVIRNISANSAKVARYRLRKKLSLAPEEDVVEFLQRI